MSKELIYCDYESANKWAGFILDSETGEISDILDPADYDKARADGLRRAYFSEEEHETATYGIFSLYDVLEPGCSCVAWPDQWDAAYVKLVCAIIESAWAFHLANQKAKHTRAAHTRRTKKSGVVSVKGSKIGEIQNFQLELCVGDVCAYLETIDVDALADKYEAAKKAAKPLAPARKTRLKLVASA